MSRACIGEQAPAHIDRLLDDLFGRLLGDLFDVDAAGRAYHHYGRLAGAIEDDADVVLLGDIDGGRDQHFLDGQPFDVHAEDLAGDLASLLRRVAELDAARLATSADVDLRLDDDGYAKLAGDRFGLLGGGGDLAGLHGNAVPAQDFLRLVLMNLQLFSSLK